MSDFKKFKIDKNIPMPLTGRYSPLLDMLGEMKIGDSILTCDQKERDRISAAMRRLKYRPTSRKVKDGYRLWRCKT